MKQPMKLSRIERLILSNQYRILEALEPDQGHEVARQVVERGYEAHYDWITEHVDEPASMSADECTEVMDILDMFRALSRSASDLAASGEELGDVPEFLGFDGNHEKQFGYAKYLIQVEQKWTEHKGAGDGLNSHSRELPSYRRMCAKWAEWDKPHQLSAGQIRELADARFG